MAEIAVVGFNCSNSDCRRLFKMRHPGKPGYFKVKCPYCGHPVVVKMPGVQTPQAEDVTDEIKTVESRRDTTSSIASVQGQSGDRKEEECERPRITDHSGNAVISFSDYPDGNDGFFVGRVAQFTCPHCRAFKFSYTSEKTGAFNFTCPQCKGKVRVNFKKPTEFITSCSFGKACRLVHMRSLWRKTVYHLPIGEHTIGRADFGMPSTISIDGDSSMSRRSVSIKVTFSEREGFRYLLKVLNATNPVRCGRKFLCQGEEIYIGPGQKFVLGNSSFVLDADTKSRGSLW